MIKEFKIFFDMDEEEKYLLEKAKKGLSLKSHSLWGYYTFEKTEPHEYSYKVDYRIFLSGNSFKKYVAKNIEDGWIHVYGEIYSGNQYFRVEGDSPFRYNLEYKISRYKRLLNVGLVAWLCVIIYTFFYLFYYSKLIETFEYEFNLIQNIGMVLPIIITIILNIVSIVWIAKAYLQYINEKKKYSK